MALNNVKDSSATLPGNVAASADPSFDTDVLIAGAGPTGLVLAIDLARRGVRALVAERADRLSQGARGTGLQPRTQEVYEDLGLLAAMRAAGGRYPKIAVWEDGRKVAERAMIEEVEPTPSAPFGTPWMLPQWRNLELLHDRLRELGGSVTLGAALESFTQDERGVSALLTQADGTTRTVRARYLVAADGGRSTVRKALGIGMAGQAVTAHTMLLADVRITGLDRDNWHMWSRSTGVFAALLPLAGTDLFQSVCGFEGLDAEPDTSPEGVRALLAARTHLTADQITEVRWTSVFRPRAAMADRFRVGRVFLAGDAAHIHSPAGGQGLNTSVQDAYNLGWKLAQVLRHGAGDALLDTYEAERLPIAARILDTSSRLHRTQEMRRGRELHQLDVGYPDSPLTAEHRHPLPDGVARAGDRAPDAPCTAPDGTPVRLFDVFRGPHFTLLAVGDAEPPALDGEAAELVRTYRVGAAGGAEPVGAGLPATDLVTTNPVATDLIDTDGHARRAYGEGLFLVRPDGYLACATHDARDLPAALRAVGVPTGSGAVANVA
ncbi:FAD-dependent monooxygenase [Streptomyces sp. NPDC003077]|uniref:FAD-dependent monooxygenase n=1 Tax=Streptomyces sp. NPDC003077 TaxID=3154443 RepID=UPI0033A3DBCF